LKAKITLSNQIDHEFLRSENDGDQKGVPGKIAWKWVVGECSLLFNRRGLAGSQKDGQLTPNGTILNHAGAGH
jgi:hypothetical protein